MPRVIAIHQPQYIPWLPYIDKILQSEVFVCLDHVQFQKNGFQNRNQIKTAQGALWLTFPIRHKFGQRICDTKIAEAKALKKNLATIKTNYQKAPYFKELFPAVEHNFLTSDLNLSALCYRLLTDILEYLSYSGEIIRSVDLNLSSKANDLIQEICQTLDADVYLSGQGARTYLRRESFERQNISVEFQRYSYPNYEQLFPKQGFIACLSVLDLLFNVGPGSRQLIERGRLTPEGWTT